MERVFCFQAMGCPGQLRVDAVTGKTFDRAIDLVVEEVERLEAYYSRFIAGSPWNALLAQAVRADGVRVNLETAALLDLAAEAWRRSDGCFDAACGALVNAWDWRAGRHPGDVESARALVRSGWHHVSWQRPRLWLPPGVELDLDGLVKEYAADSAAACLRRVGIRHALVNLGGDIAVVGPRRDGRAWRVGISTPGRRSTPLAVVELAVGGLATSGDYERAMVLDGRRYSHILDPRSGRPVHGLASVSVVAPHCVTAGILATSAMVKGPGSAGDWLEQSGAPHHIVTEDCELYGSLATSSHQP